jgi:hypothetical protein
VAEQAKITLTAEDKTSSAFASAKRNIQNLQAAVAGAFGGGAFAAFQEGAEKAFAVLEHFDPRGIIAAGDELSKLSQRSGIAVEALQGIEFAAKLAGVGTDELATDLKRFAVNVAAAARGSAEQLAAFQAIGISQKFLRDNVGDTEKVLRTVADQFEIYGDGAKKVAVANALGGKSFERLIPTLDGGSKAIDAARTEVEQFGAAFDSGFAQKSREFTDNMTRLEVALTATKVAIAGGLIDKLVELSDEMVVAAKNGGLLKFAIERMFDVFSGKATRDFVKDALPPDSVKAAQENVDRLQQLVAKLQADLDVDPGNVGLEARLARLKVQAKQAADELEKARQDAKGVAVGSGDFTRTDHDTTSVPKPKQVGDIVPRVDQNALLDKQLQTRLASIQQNLQAEQQIIKFNEQFVDAALKAGTISLEANFSAQDELRRRNLEEIRKDVTATIAAEQASVAARPPPQNAQDEQKNREVAETAKKNIQAAREKLKNAEREFQEATDLSAATRPGQRDVLKEQVAAFNAAVDDLIAGGRNRAAEFADIAAKVRVAQNLATEGGASDTDAAAQAQRLGALLETQRQFNLARDDFARVTDRARDAEEALGVVQKQGSTGLVEGEQQLMALRSEELRQLDALIERTRALSEANPDNGAIADGLRKLELEALKLKATLDPTKLRLSAAVDDVGNALADGLDRAAAHADSLKNILRDLGKQVQQIVLHELVTKPIGVEISNTLKTGFGLTKTDPTSLRDRSVAERAAGLGGTSKPADQISALGENTAALNALTAVITGAPAPGSLTVDKSGQGANTGDFTRGDHDTTPVAAPVGDLTKATDTARANVDGFGKAAGDAQGALGLFSRVTGIGSGALSQIPVIVKALGGIVRGIGSLFTGGYDLSGTGSGAAPGFTGAENFDTGGFTGNISPKEVAGVVHGGEFVFSAPAVRRVGVTALETAHTRAVRGFEAGGLVGMPGVHRRAVQAATQLVEEPVRVPGFEAGGYVPVLGLAGPGASVPGFEAGGYVAVPGFASGGFVAALRGTSAPAWSKGYAQHESTVAAMPPPEWKVQVINNQSGVSEARTQQLDDGTLQIIIDAAAAEGHRRVAADHASAAGPSSKALKGRGVNLGSGPRRF